MVADKVLKVAGVEMHEGRFYEAKIREGRSGQIVNFKSQLIKIDWNFIPTQLRFKNSMWIKINQVISIKEIQGELYGRTF